jgi:hypothetical protein
MQLPESEGDNVANAATIRRRSTRVQTDVLIEVQGEGFAYAGETVTVNLHGALIRTSAALAIGTLVTIHVHRTGKSAPAHIVFAGSEANSQYGIELERPSNIWGISATPEDWFSAHGEAN